ncbi:hypothetical protein BFN03_07705 [Rhodococcus sp. WMMA185]|uniref:hypothetical protein n=1 Tax=Rhodococcus sp. WMMA185 TaxID=679318 RepID=UPI00087827F2|nr:hypothetical protein [Rhodococcus sp. WMMA185]AOW92615.1 hypothetical protein BFN03_07705 [Rhodococcus sp. WMMA185]
MFVLTVDQRGSRRDVDRVDKLIGELDNHDLARPFQRTAGDEVQAVVTDPATVVDLALELVARKHWSVGIGVGPAEEPLPTETRAGRGPAFELARAAVERAKRAPARVAVEGADLDSAEDADTALTLVATVVARRTDEGREAVEQIRRGRTQTEAAQALGISKQAVSQRLSTAGLQVEIAGRRLAERLLKRADG